MATYLPYHGHNLPAVVGLVVGLLFPFLVLKIRHVVARLVFFLIAAAFLSGAYWWYSNIRS